MNTTYEDIYKIHKHTIRVGEADTPALVVFSAIPGSGKSELTKRLVEDYDFSRLANKDIRYAIKQTSHTEDVVVGDYTLWLLDKLTSQNPRSIVFDRNIDQWYEPIKEWASRNNYKLIVVRIEVSRSTLEKRLHDREGDKVSHVLSVLDFYQDQHKRLLETIKVNIILREDYGLDEAAKLIAEEVCLLK